MFVLNVRKTQCSLSNSVNTLVQAIVKHRLSCPVKGEPLQASYDVGLEEASLSAKGKWSVLTGVQSSLTSTIGQTGANRG